MARRKSKNEARLLACVILIGAPIWIISTITDTIGAGTFFAAIAIVAAIVVFYFIQKRAARLAYLRTKYGDEIIVQRIMQRQFWQGQTMEQLRESLGDPPSVDNNIFKTKKREVWKYQPNGKNRYRLRVTLDNDVVVGWDQKN